MPAQRERGQAFKLAGLSPMGRHSPDPPSWMFQETRFTALSPYDRHSLRRVDFDFIIIDRRLWGVKGAEFGQYFDRDLDSKDDTCYPHDSFPWKYYNGTHLDEP
jgi:hypothetical protein